jgi:TIGR03009 family protein
MRLLGLTLAAMFVGIGSTAVHAQQPPGAGVPPVQPVVPVGAPAAPTLDDHLNTWEKTMAGIKNLRVEITRTTTDSVFKKEKKFYGPLLLMKPNLAILRFEYAGDPTKQDYEAYLCDGKSLYQYKGLEKTVTEHKLPNPATNPGAGSDYFMLDFLSGMKAKDAKDRFEITLVKEDAHYVYLNIVPKFGKDMQEFKVLSMALFGPRTPFPYLPCQAKKLSPNGDMETWEFNKPQTNIQGVDESVFRYVKVPGFREIQAPPMNPAPQQPIRPGLPVLPGANGLPPGQGTVRP